MTHNESQHASRRYLDRNYYSEDTAAVVGFSREERCPNAFRYTLRASDLPKHLPASHRFRQLVGTTVIVSYDGKIITIYPNRKYSDRKGRRCDYRLYLTGEFDEYDDLAA